MLLPKNKRLKDYEFCFYGHEFKKKNISNHKVYKELETFLKAQQIKMEIAPLVEKGKWLWEGLIEKMDRSAFCVFETESKNRNVHIELGYALAKGLNVILIIPEEQNGKYQKHLPSNLSGLVQIRYKDLNNLLRQLKEEIPKRYYSVEERLSINLENMFEAEKIYFQIIINKSQVSFSDLAAQVRAKATVLSDNISLADFIRKYDEALIIEEKEQLDKCKISIDNDYKEWVCKKLGIGMNSP
jgi:hypothetical protein